MEVIKRDGRRERIELDKITNRIGSLWRKEPQLNQLVDPVKVAIKVAEGLYDGVTTVDLDILAAEIAATMATVHPDYAKLAAMAAGGRVLEVRDADDDKLYCYYSLASAMGLDYFYVRAGRADPHGADTRAGRAGFANSATVATAACGNGSGGFGFSDALVWRAARV